MVNTGSSSVKLRLVGPDDTVLGARDLDLADGEVPGEEVATALRELPEPEAVGHRVVHGGQAYTGPVRVDGEVLRRLRGYTDLAPLHQPKALAGIQAIEAALPGVTQVACFDTAFHATLPPEVTTYAIPGQWRKTYGLRRYGFHGLSHAYAARRSGEMLGRDPGRLVVAHLGAGASLSAVRGDECVDTTMGFTPLEGLVMATRSGDVDPGMLLWLLRHTGMTVDEVGAGLEHCGGLVGLTGTADMREVVARADEADVDASLGLSVYVHRLRAKVAGMAASLGGLDTLVFTGGVGENQPTVRGAAAEGLAFLGVDIDVTANEATRGTGDTDISAPEARVRTLVVMAREELDIARNVRALLRRS